MKARGMITGLTTVAMATAIAATLAPSASAQEHDAPPTLWGGVHISVLNDTNKNIEVCQRNSYNDECRGRTVTLKPGERIGFSDKSVTTEDDVEVAVMQGGQRVLELDGSNPAILPPNLSVTHKPTGAYEFQAFSEWQHGYMNYGRVWVQRKPDLHMKTKYFDVHIKRTDLAAVQSTK